MTPVFSVICAWCQAVIATSTVANSHGICIRCAIEVRLPTKRPSVVAS